MAKNIKEIGLSTDPKAENTYKAQQHPVTKDWYVDFLPGSLPVGIRRFFQYVGHENDLSGMTFGPLVFQDNAEGWLSSAVGVEILDVPDDFYTWPDDLRWKTLRGFDPVAGLANFTNDDFKKLQAHREQLAAQKAAAEAERLRQEMLKQGVCQICLSARGQMVVHPPEQCPLLHPTGPQTTQPQRSISQKQPPSAEQSLASQSVPSLTSDGSSVSAEFLYHGRPVSGAITIPFSDRQNPGLVLRWQGAKVNLFYVRVGGASARSQRTESEIQFSFSNWDRGSYVVEATPESASGVKSTPLRLKIILR